MKVTLIQETQNPLKIIGDSASICYGKDEAKNPERLVRNLLKLKHGSVFEHVYFTWKIEGVSGALLAQLTRHRHASFTVRSQRYCDESGQDLIVPDTIKGEDSTYLIWHHITREVKSTYDQLIKRGVPKEDARFILPQATSTDLYMSCNLRELLHIYNLRSDESAQWEIQELVEKLKDSINPDLHFMFEKQELEVGMRVKVIAMEGDVESIEIPDYIGEIGTVESIDIGHDYPYYVKFDNPKIEDLYFGRDELQII